jgi:mono/diheme cytochrome c family protein
MKCRAVFTLVPVLLLPPGGGGRAAEQPSAPVVRAMAGKYCVDCHDAEVSKGNLNLADLLADEPARHPDVWEKVVRRLRARQMPPAGKARPDEAEYVAVLAALETPLDRAAAAQPKPGRTETIRRLNRTEYQNAIRDLLAVEIDATTLLPADEASHGFDNITVGTLSPTLLDRYITAAQKIARLAVGGAARVPGGETYRIRPDITQEERVEGLPFGTRGGAVIRHTFAQDGEYEIQLRLARDRNDLVEGLKEPHQMLVLVDGAQVHEFTVKPPGGRGHNDVDTGLNVRLPMKAGAHQLGVTFLKNPSSLLEMLRQPYNVHFNFHRHPRISPALYQVSVTGPFNAKGPGNSASRRRIFIAQPKSAQEEETCARQILSTLLRRAWRRPVNDADLARVLPFYEEARKEAGFDAGIEAALSAILVSREFLFRTEQEPKGLKPGTPYRVSDVELASRLSFFVWSSIPDEELLALAERGELAKPAVLAQQTRRMLADMRAESLVKNFAGQWLHLRNLDSITPDGRLFPDFDDNLRQAMRRETEMLFTEILREDRSVLDLLRADHTFLNERLAKHYEIPHVYGSHFRRVALGPESQRGGLLRHGSVLTVTSYATRTSPVIRGKWVLENLLGTPPPPPEPDVPALDDSQVSESLPIRERLAAHRNKPACASCHEFIDPPGFALENYDAVGRWRTSEAGLPVDNSGGLPDGSRFNGVTGIEEGLLARPEIFTAALTEKLLTFALGRGVEPFDGPAVRGVLRAAKADNYRLSAIVIGIVNSIPFTMRQSL